MDIKEVLLQWFINVSMKSLLVQLISKYSKGFSLCVIDSFSKYACVVPLRDKKVSCLITFFMNFKTRLIEYQTKNG